MLTVVLTIIALLLLLGLITALQSARVELEYWRDGNDDRLLLNLRGPYGIVFQQLDVPVIDLAMTGQGPALNYRQHSQDALGGEQRVVRSKLLLKEGRKLQAIWRKLRPVWQSYRPAAGYLLRHVHLDAFTWETKLGVDDAAATGLLVGAAWALKGSLLTLLQTKLRLGEDRASVTVAPSFSRSHFSTFLHCIFTIRIVHVINVQLQLLGYKLRQRKR